MTNEEAIEILQEERDYAQFPKYVRKSIEIATSAIKKQIPQTPNLSNFGLCRIKAYNCPVCGKGCLVRTDSYCPKYCSNCGQALDWSDIK